jgi:hypothetical protein
MNNPAARPQGIKKLVNTLYFVIPAPYQVRDKLQQESREKGTGFRIKCGMTEIRKPHSKTTGNNKI